MYKLIKPLLFQLDTEHAHCLALQSLKWAHKLKLSPNVKKSVTLPPVNIMGLAFPNRIGLAAGLDKNGEYVDALANLGFGFIEIGTLTPKPQSGNPKPRLFRLVKEQAIINRMGFNNKGIYHAIHLLEKIKYRGILGINIGKNRDTPLDHAIEDYLLGLRMCWQYASYITINISSPNTPELRDLQQSKWLRGLLDALKCEQALLNEAQQKYVPLVVKISPDLSDEELHEIAEILLEQKIDGVIATNTTIARNGIEGSPHATETGGLSGKPLQAHNLHCIKQLHAILQDRIPIIASGGIMDVKSAAEQLNAGARLLQVYSGLIYSGPALVKKLLQANITPQ